MSHNARLPRRLTAEREFVALLGKGCAVMDIDKNAAYSIVIFSHGVAALVGDSEDRSLAVRDVDAKLPRFALCVAASGAVSWAEKTSAAIAATAHPHASGVPGPIAKGGERELGHYYAPCRPPTPGDLRRGA